MELMKVLVGFSEIANRMSEYYLWLMRNFKGDSEASSFFLRLSQDEVKNYLDVNSGIKSLIKSGEVFKEIEISSDLMCGTLSRINYFKIEHPHPSLEQALEFAISFEGDEARRNLFLRAGQSQPGIEPLVKSLLNADQRHLQALQQFFKKRQLRGSTQSGFQKSSPVAQI